MAEEKPMNPTTEQSAPEPVKPAEPVAPVTPDMPPSSTPSSEVTGGGGKRVALIVGIVLVLAIGAVVAGFISSRRAREAGVGQGPEAPLVTQEDTMTTQYSEQSASDEVSAIESDLQNTSFDGIDREMTEIDKELSKQE